jgi:hypothetical protein
VEGLALAIDSEISRGAGVEGGGGGFKKSSGGSGFMEMVCDRIGDAKLVE